MKKAFIFLFTLALLCLLTACSGCGGAPARGAPSSTEGLSEGIGEGVTDTSTAENAAPETAQEPPYTVTVTCTIPMDEVSFSGGGLVQSVEEAAAYVPVTVSVGEDYVYRGYKIGGVLYEGTTLRLPAEITADTEIRVVAEYLTQELPVVSVNTGGVAVDSRGYVDMTLSLTGTEDELIGVHGSIRLRGNSTYSLVKKPYRIKFNQKHSLFGLDKAKSWVLLADYLDPSTLHNYAALTLAGTSEHLEFVPTPHKVNLYLNGEFMGLYTLCEQVQEQAGRLDLEVDITESMSELSDYSFLLCLNHNAPEKAGAVEGETYFYLSACDRYFELEYPQKKDFPTEAQFYRFFDALEDYMRETVTAFQRADRAYLSKHVDMDSLIDLFIVDQIMGERDHHWKSLFMYYRGAEGETKLRFGPPWDYDFCMFTQWTGEPNEEFDLSNSFNPAEASVFYRPLLNNAYYSSRVQSRYRDHFSEALAEVTGQVEDYAARMEQSLALNQERWYGDKPTITEDNVEFFVKYLETRRIYLDRTWRE